MKRTSYLLVAGLSLALGACSATMDSKPAEDAKPMATAELNNNDFYEVHHEGRLYLFDDYATYQSFLEVGETSFRHTFIGDGPKGETLVFGLTGKDKKKTAEKIASYNLFHGNLDAAADFYGEMRSEGRIYVFDRYEDMETVRTTGEAPLRYTEIGTGPKGETVVYVLRNDNKKQKPVALQAAFKQRNGLM
ncbi:hypothetical protein [Motiliproteus sediminis]|uniref:hypothetical protein n=1 Tax=Motiliproteus sediminis TaxID=1468178 RepID=UPI001AEF771D|nr:hypothetical protein [Motiliproteus sediminis]